MKNNFKKLTILYFLISIFIFSCSKDEINNDKGEPKITNKLFKGKNKTKAGGDAAGTYTYYSIKDEHKTGTTMVQVDVQIYQLGNITDNLFFPALQANFLDEGAHIGWQSYDYEKWLNWGGYFNEFTNSSYRYTPFFNQGPDVTDEDEISDPVIYHPDPNVDIEVGHFSPGTYTQCNDLLYNWSVGTKYRYIVERGTAKSGFYRWYGKVKNLTTNEVIPIGILYTKTGYIDGFSVWVETSIMDKAVFDVRWTSPKYKSNGTTYSVDKNEITADVSNNPNNTVVAPSSASWNSYQTTWHRNGLSVPSSAYKYVTNTHSW